MSKQIELTLILWNSNIEELPIQNLAKTGENVHLISET